MSKPRTPADLGTRAKRLWTRVASVYDLRDDELIVLEDACREVALVDRLEAELRDKPLMVQGSMGQLVASPLVSELRQHRAVVARLLAQLKLPDEDGRAQESVSNAARKAANARWQRGA